jgi:hydroxypyruvate reductase
MDPRRLLIGSFNAAVAAADPARCLPPRLPKPPSGRTLVVGGGKAAASMAAAVEAHWPASAPLSGLVVTRYRHALPTQRIEVVEASHPLPDGRGEAAALRMLEMAAALSEDDLLLALISGGGSSLLAAPVEGVSLKSLRQVTQALLHCGAAIQEINIVRKHLTRLSGGQLACAAGKAQVVALMISDVAGDDPAYIASGPCTPDPSTAVDALQILRRFGIDAPAAVWQHLEAVAAGQLADTPKPGSPCFARLAQQVIGSARASLDAAADFFRDRGIEAIVLSDRISADAEDAAREHAGLVSGLAASGPLALISGGETTVTVRNPSGRGGRNCAYVLALAHALAERQPLWALACDTDGIDGTEDNAGAIITPDTLARGRALGLDAETCLRQNNSHDFFAALGDLVVTGPTRTNVNDYRVMLLGVDL